MKLQLGMLKRDGGPATYEDLTTLLGEFGQTKCETMGEFLDGPLLLAYRGDRITAEEDNENQPYILEHFAITFDGRLDNRDEIGGSLRLSDLENIPDPVIVLKAYLEFGESSFRDLLGEFAFTIASRKDRVILFVRSFCGARPLYYVLNSHCLMWASSFAHLVRVSGIEPQTDQQYVLEYLIAEPSRTRTPLANVHSAPPGTILRYTNGSFDRAKHFWTPFDAVEVRCSSDLEYEELFRHHLKDAVRARRRSNRTVFAELSGGLDSSSIVLLADELSGTSASERPLTSLETVSCVYDQSETCDERRFIEMVEEKRCIPTHLVHEDEQHFTLGIENTTFSGLPNPMHLHWNRYPRFSEILKDHNARVLLTGIGGDHLFCSSPEGATVAADLLRAGLLLRAHRECKLWSTIQGIPYLRLLQQAFGLAFGRRMPHGNRTEHPALPSWIAIDNAAATQSGLSQLTTKNGIPPSMSFRARVVELLIDLLCLGHMIEYETLYVSHPYTHRPLVEFCIGIPMTQLLRNGENRSLMRRALSNTLPQRIAQRKSKGSIDEAIARTVQREWHILHDLNDWEVCRRGYVYAPEYRKAMENLKLGKLEMTGSAARVCVLEQWLRSLVNIRQALKNKHQDHPTHRSPIPFIGEA